MSQQPVAVILGGTGFIGRAVERELGRHGVAVRSYGSSTLDLTDAGALSRIDDVPEDTTLLFLAALTPDRGMTLDTLSRNVAMATNVATFTQRHRVKKLLYVSSDAVYGAFGLGRAAIDEDTPVELPNLYAVGKYVTERILRQIASERSLPLVMRPTGVFGPGDPHGSYGPNRFIRSMRSTRAIRVFGNGEERRDHLYVIDLATIVARLALDDTTGLLNVATGRSRSFAEVVDALRKLDGGEITIEQAPRTGAITHQRFNIARLRRALSGLRFTPFEAALRQTWRQSATTPVPG
jgi:UDP-glucose 4-epimerase